MGGSGDPSPYTAYGVFMGMKACANYKWGSDSLEGRTVVVQGVGHVGETVVKHATEAGANVIVNDIYDDTLENVASKYNAEIFKGDIYDLDMDIYAPCALGATINDNTIDRIKCEIVAGAANNQLALEDKHGTLLKERGIIYAPDFLINAGGLINVNSEIAKYSTDEVMTRTEDIYNTTMRIINESDALDITTHQAALKIAQERIDAAKK
jgi:leucine dehydrogenase